MGRGLFGNFLKTINDGNDLVIYNKTTDPVKKEEYRKKLVANGVIPDEAPAPVEIKAEEPVAVTVQAASETKAETPTELASTSIETKSEITEEVSSALAELDIKEIIFNHSVEYSEKFLALLDIMGLANKGGASKLEAVKQLINLNLEKINKELITKIVKSKDIILAKEVINIGNHEFNKDIIECIKNNSSNIDDKPFMKIVLSYSAKHNGDLSKIKDVANSYFNATDKNETEYLAQAVEKESDFIGEVFDYFTADTAQ